MGARLISLTMRVAAGERRESLNAARPVPPAAQEPDFGARLETLERLHATPDNMELTPEVLREDLDELSALVAFDREALQKVCAAVGIEVVARDPAEQLDVFPATHVEKCDDCGGAKIKKGHK